MATYKVIQDIEAEDKILGPLTLRQFIFAMIAVFLFYMCFLMVVKHVLFMLVIFLPPALFFGFFALPFGRDQPTEVWFLAKLRFWFKPRRRVWNQSGVKELVTITVPKKIERIYTNGLSQNEVQSRLQTLAQTIDTRGWATKHVNSDIYSQPVSSDSSDRLLDMNSWPQEVPADDVPIANDIMDAATSPIARQFDTMIDQSSRDRRQRLVSQLDDSGASQAATPAAAADNWFTGVPHPAPAAPIVVAPPTVTAQADTPVDPQSEATMAAGLTARAESKQAFGNLRTMRPLSDQPVAAPPPALDDTAVTAPGDPAILSLAASNDLNLSTLAREAKKTRDAQAKSPDEVVVPLH